MTMVTCGSGPHWFFALHCDCCFSHLLLVSVWFLTGPLLSLQDGYKFEALGDDAVEEEVDLRTVYMDAGESRVLPREILCPIKTRPRRVTRRGYFRLLTRLWYCLPR